MRLHTLAVGSAVTVLALSGLAASTASATPATGSVTTNPTTPPTRCWPGRSRRRRTECRSRSTTTPPCATSISPTVPGATSGWHKHPGIVLAVVKSGTVTRKSKCERTETFTAGQAFTEVGAHFVRNPGTEPAVLAITQILPADAPAFRVDIDKPKCHRNS